MLDIKFEDEDLIVVVKPAGVDSQSAAGFGRDMVSELKKHLKRNGAKELYVGVVHRLDKPVSGLMVYAKSKKAAAALSSQVKAGGHMDKVYSAVVAGAAESVPSLIDFLVFDKGSNSSFISNEENKEAKRAELSLSCIKTTTVTEWLADDSLTPEFNEQKRSIERAITGAGQEALAICEKDSISILRVVLKTGRHHQIRVQLSGHNNPIIGDLKYNKAFAEKPIRNALCLCASELSFIHPVTKQKLNFTL